jgi:hypothetical protein
MTATTVKVSTLTLLVALHVATIGVLCLASTKLSYPHLSGVTPFSNGPRRHQFMALPFLTRAVQHLSTCASDMLGAFEVVLHATHSHKSCSILWRLKSEANLLSNRASTTVKFCDRQPGSLLSLAHTSCEKDFTRS